MKKTFRSPVQKARHADYIAANVMSDIGGTRYELIAQNKIFRIWTAMPWRFALYNSLETAACASACGYVIALFRAVFHL